MVFVVAMVSPTVLAIAREMVQKPIIHAMVIV